MLHPCYFSPASRNHVLMDVCSTGEVSRQGLERSVCAGLLRLYTYMKTQIGMKSLTKVKESADRGTWNPKSSSNKCKSCNYGALLVVVSQGTFCLHNMPYHCKRIFLLCFINPDKKKTSHYLEEKTAINCVISSHLR